MSISIEGFYIFDDQNNCILEQIYQGRPPKPQELASRFAKHPLPRPSILQFSDLYPSTTAYSLRYSNLFLVVTNSKDAQSLAILEFLYRIVDIFEEFLGRPLISIKLEENYETVAQILVEVCDGGVICNTETNALRESIEVSSTLGKLFSQVGIPSSSPSLTPTPSSSAALRPSNPATSGSAIPWRKANVRHTSNELYVDIVESLNVIFAPSGRALSARSHGSIAFTAKISGVPDLILMLSAPGGTSTAKSAGINRTMQLPTFHPCVRLARWKDHPGELSFVPPDGRFMLAGYEVDLLPYSLNEDSVPSRSSERMFLPAMVDMKAGLGQNGTEFEVKLTLSNNFPGVQSSARSGASGRPGAVGPSTSTSAFSFGSASASGSSSTPTIESVIVTIPFPPDARNVTDFRCSRGDANFNIATKTVEWKVPTREAGSLNGTATLTGSVMGTAAIDNADDALDLFEDVDADAEHDAVVDDDAVARTIGKANTQSGYYDEDTVGEVTTAKSKSKSKKAKSKSRPKAAKADVSTNTVENANTFTTSNAQQQKLQTRQQQRLLTNKKRLMPRSVAVSFSVKGWLPSGIKVESLFVDAKKSKGLGEGVKPYKGVKYLTVSSKGVERRVT